MEIIAVMWWHHCNYFWPSLPFPFLLWKERGLWWWWGLPKQPPLLKRRRSKGQVPWHHRGHIGLPRGKQNNLWQTSWSLLTPLDAVHWSSSWLHHHEWRGIVLLLKKQWYHCGTCVFILSNLFLSKFETMSSCRLILSLSDDFVWAEIVCSLDQIHKSYSFHIVSLWWWAQRLCIFCQCLKTTRQFSANKYNRYLSECLF